MERRAGGRVVGCSISKDLHDLGAERICKRLGVKPMAVKVKERNA